MLDTPAVKGLDELQANIAKANVPSLLGLPLYSPPEQKPALAPTAAPSATPTEYPETPTPNPQVLQAPPGRSATPAAPGSAQADISGKLNADYNARIGAMGEEANARGAAADAEAGALGNAADTQQTSGELAEQKAHEDRGQQNTVADEIHQLTQDYASGHIDDRKWWNDQSVPQKIATVLGGMLAGASGGPRGAAEFYDRMINRSIALQQEELHRKGEAGKMTDNLLGSLMKSSKDEEEAVGKARALQYNAAMLEVQKAAAAARGPVEQAQIKQLIADMALARDMALMPRPGVGTGAGAVPKGWMPLTEEQRGAVFHDPNTGEEFLTANKTVADKLVEDAKSHDDMISLLDRAEQNLKERQALAKSGLFGSLGERVASLNPYSDAYKNLTEGESIANELKGQHAKFFSSRGVTPGIERVSQGIVGDLASRSAVWNPQKIDQYRQYIHDRLDESRNASSPIPIRSVQAPGGKQGILTTYVQVLPGREPSDRNAPRPPPSRGTPPSFKPGK